MVRIIDKSPDNINIGTTFYDDDDGGGGGGGGGRTKKNDFLTSVVGLEHI